MENKYLYHGSIVKNIKHIKNNSKLHNSKNMVVYLTDNICYALIYIWDSKHNIREKKYITAYVKDGITCYEEQFPNQFKEFYDGVSGYIYLINKDEETFKYDGSESIFYRLNDVEIYDSIYISNVYEELMKYKEKGLFKLITFDEVSKEKIDELYKHIEKSLIEKKIINDPNSNESLFYRRYFPTIWERAINRKEE